MAADRSLGRDIFIYLASHPTVCRGGAVSGQTFTETTFLDSLDVLIDHTAPIRVYRRNDHVQIQRTQTPLSPGEYEVDSDGKLFITIYVENWKIYLKKEL
jgi:hypothetical protein